MSKRPLAEIAIVFGLIFATIWIAPRLSDDKITANRIGYALAVAAGGVAIASTIFRGESWRDIGLRLDNFFRALGRLAGPTLLLVAGLLIAGDCLDSWHFGARAFRLRPARWLWPVAQQYLLQGFLNRRLQDVYGRGWLSVLLIAAIFGLLHLPNPVLVAATLVAGCIWARAYQREPNLLALAISHAVLSFVLSHTLPVSILPNLKVGWAYLR